MWNIHYFDAVIGNPPFNTELHRTTIWQHFTKIALEKWIFNDGYLLFVHPSGWRKPNTERGRYIGLFELMTNKNQMIYLEIHSKKDGWNTFNCGTRYDWYLIKHSSSSSLEYTLVIDELGNKNKIDMKLWKWLPNSNIELIKSILANEEEEKCNILYDRTAYGTDKIDRISSEKTDAFRFPCIHSTLKNSTRYMYSKVNDKGHFGIPKVIFGESGIFNPILDLKGEYGMTQCAMGIIILNKEEGECICNAITSKKFSTLIKSCMFSSFRIDWRMFLDFKRDFWEKFLS